jgi:hypothetical protein
VGRAVSDGLGTREAVSRSRHDAAVSNTLRQADDAATQGDLAGALSWLAMLEAIGDALPSGYSTKRQAWLGALSAKR